MMHQKKRSTLFHNPGLSVAMQFRDVVHRPNDVSRNNKRITLCMWVFMLYQRVLRHNNMGKKIQISLVFNTFVFKILNVSFCYGHLME